MLIFIREIVHQVHLEWLYYILFHCRDILRHIFIVLQHLLYDLRENKVEWAFYIDLLMLPVGFTKRFRFLSIIVVSWKFHYKSVAPISYFIVLIDYAFQLFIIWYNFLMLALEISYLLAVVEVSNTVNHPSIFTFVCIQLFRALVEKGLVIIFEIVVIQLFLYYSLCIKIQESCIIITNY